MNERGELEDRLRFETLIADLSSRFVNLPAGEVDREIMDAERQICEALDLDFCALWQVSSDTPGFFFLTHFYSALEGPQPPGRMNQDQYPWARQEMLAGRVIKVSSLEDLPVEAARDRETLRQFGIKSNLALPFLVGGKPSFGLLGLGTMRAERDWPDAQVNRLQVVARIFANALARKRAEEALRESEERLNLAVSSAQAGIWALNCHTQVFWASDQARLIFGYPPEEMLSLERFKASVHPDDWSLVQASLARAAQVGDPVNVEYRIRLGDGSERWIASRGRPSFKSTGEPERLLGLSMDITERKRTEDQLRQRSLAVEQSPVSVVITDAEGKIVYVNRKFSEVSGYSFTECTGQNPRFLKSGECPRSVYEELWTCITRGGTWQGEFHNRRKNGELYWEWAVISPLLSAAGKVTHFVGIKEDITERKRGEEALRASEARLMAGTELAGLGYYEVDYAQETCFMDGRFRDICGVPAEVQQGLDPVKFWLEHVHPDDLQLISQERQKLHDGKLDLIALEYRYLHPTKGQQWLHHSARVASRQVGGGGARTFGVVRDITVQKQAEEALLKSYAEIERLKDKLQAESDYLKAEVKVTQAHGEVIGKSPPIRKVLSLAEQVAPTDSSVLISGETGTGKELIAQTIHRLSTRGSHVMVKVNCAALPAALVESELFGREKGAFTGALMRQIGRFEVADGSTIFLDELGELSLEVQAKLLRVVQDGQFERLGSPRTIKVNLRVIAATNRDLREEVRKGRFREDLYYRLDVFPIRVPPLRERVDDIPLLVWAFLEEFASRMGKRITRVPRKTMEMLQRHPWPGNIRELRNVIEHSTIITTGDTLKVPMFEQPPPEALPVQTLAESEREHIMKALEKTNWLIKGPKGAAALLGLNPSTMYGRMRKLEIPGRRQKDAAES